MNSLWVSVNPQYDRWAFGHREARRNRRRACGSAAYKRGNASRYDQHRRPASLLETSRWNPLGFRSPPRR